MRKIILVLFVFISVRVTAQQGVANMTISLKQAIDLGLKNRYDVKANKYNIEIATNHVNKVKSDYLPDLSAGGNIRYNPQVQGTFIPAGFLSPAPVTATFGAKANSVFGLDLDQTIFKPGISDDVKISKNDLAIEQEKNRQEENNVREQISRSYLNILLKNLQIEILKNEEQRYLEYHQLAEGKFKLGTLIENDLLKAKLDYENAKVATSTAIQNYQLAQGNIKYLMNIPTKTEITLSDSLYSTAILSNNVNDKYIADSRTEIKLLQLNQESNNLQLSKSIHSTLPSISFYANYSQQFQYSSFKYGDGRWWSPFSYLGLRLTIPITAYLKNSHNIKENQIRLLQTDLLLKQKRSDIDYEIQKASIELSNAIQNMNTTKNNYELSGSIYNTQKQQYDLGALLYSNLLETDRSLNTAEQNYVRAVYDYLIAKVNYQHAVGIY